MAMGYLLRKERDIDEKKRNGKETKRQGGEEIGIPVQVFEHGEEGARRKRKGRNGRGLG